MSDNENNEEIVDTFFLAFVGELVGIVYNAGKNAVQLSGYLLDYDDEYYYLGDSEEEITNAIKKNRVIHIQVLDPENEYQQILEELEVPEDETQKN